MNLDKYEKIDGREALRRLADGEDVFMELINETVKLKLAEDGLRCDVAGYENQVTYLTFNQIYTNGGLYVPKPFDVRQAMIERPNEWVGKYSVQDEEKTIWYYVGFDSKNFCALRMKKRNKYGMKEPVKWNGGNVVFAIDDDLDACIPIEDVPEEANQ